MSKREFWQAAYIAALMSGQPPKVARGYADDALTHMIAEWDD